MIALPLLLVVSAHAVTVRAAHAPVTRAASSVLPRIALAAGTSSGTGATVLTRTLFAAADAPSALPTPSLGLAPDREAALVVKLAAKLSSQDATSRAKTADWIRDIALETPRAAVQAAAVGALAEDAENSRNLVHFQRLAENIEAVAAATTHDAVFEDAVGRLVDAARRSGRAQRDYAMLVAERIGRGAPAERRERAAALIESLAGDPAFRMDENDPARIAARVRAGR